MAGGGVKKFSSKTGLRHTFGGQKIIHSYLHTCMHSYL